MVDLGCCHPTESADHQLELMELVEFSYRTNPLTAMLKSALLIKKSTERT